MFSKTKLKFDDIFENRLCKEDVREYLIKLYENGETAEDIASAASAMKEHMIALNIPYGLKEEIIDNCGTNCDCNNTFNISPWVAILAAACGSKIAKHDTCNNQNTDILKYLGININIILENQIKMLEDAGFCFMLKQNHHLSMKNIQPILKTISHRTIFDIIIPLSNPAMRSKQIIGVYDIPLISKVAQALTLLGTKRAMVVSSKDNMDLISLSDVTHAAFIERGSIREFIIDPREYGFSLSNINELQVATANENASLTKGILDGTITDAKRDIVLLNTGFTLLVDGKVKSTEDGIIMAKEAIKSGKAIKRLQQIIDVSNKLQ